MKRIVIIFILFSFTISLIAQQSNLLELAKRESSELRLLEEEISYFRNLLIQKEEIQKLYKENNLYSIKKSFKKNTAKLDVLFENELAKAINHRITELDVIFSDIEELQDQLLYYHSKYARLIGNTGKSQELLELILEKYPRTSLYNDILLSLGDVYVYDGQDQRYIDLYQNFSGEISANKKYILAQAYYNLGELEKAEDLFMRLSYKPDYALRSKAMLALISYQTKGVEGALVNFLALRNEINPNTQDYDFIILSIARIYEELGDVERSLAHYNLYDDMNKLAIDDEILFELGNANNNAQNFGRAIFYFNEIIKKTPKSEFFVAAKFHIASAEQNRGSFNVAEDNLSEIISHNELAMNIMNKKYSLLDKYRVKLAEMHRNDISDSKRAKLKEELSKIDGALQKTNGIIRSLYVNLDKKSINTLEIIEEEYKSYVSTLAKMSVLIKLSNYIPNKKIADIINKSISGNDSTEISLEIIRLLGHRSSFTNEEYSLARRLAYEKIMEKEVLDTWEEVEQLAIANEKDIILSKIKLSKSLIKDNLRAIDIIAEYLLSGTPNDEFKTVIDNEIDAIAKNREDLKKLRKQVIRNFNKKIALKLDKKRQMMSDEFAEIKGLYNKAFGEVMTQIGADKENHELTYLDLLFKQTQINDEDYNEYQEKIRNEQ